MFAFNSLNRSSSLGRARRARPSAPGLRSPVEQLEGRLLMATGVFGNTRAVLIFSDPNETPTPASVYASRATAFDLDGPIREVRVTLYGFTHKFPEDVDILLMSPSGTSVILMSDAGGQLEIPDPGVDITFADDASRDVPQFDQIAGGVYRPTNYDNEEQGQEPFPFPAPEPPYETSLSAFNGEDPTPDPDPEHPDANKWSLYISDDTAFGADGEFEGALNYGWEITISTGAEGPPAPSAPNLAPSSDTGLFNDDNVTRDTSPTFTGTASAGTEIHLFSGGMRIATAPITNGTYTVTPSLEHGTYTLTARAVDAAGNEGDASEPITVNIDVDPPNTPIPPDLTAASDTGQSNTDDVTSDTTPTFEGTAHEGATVTLIANGRPIGTGTVAQDGSYTATVNPALPAGAYDISVAVTDLAGNQGLPSDTIHVVIEGVVQEFGPVTQVFVNGPGLTGGSTAEQVAFRNLAGIDNTFGYPVPAGANQTRSIPWNGGVNSIAIRLGGFAGPFEQGDLQVRGVAVPTYTVQSFSFDAPTRTGVWTLAQAITNDKLRLVLDDALVPGLDGEWTDGADTFPSGNGVLGGDFSFRVNVLGGDATQDGVVNALDLSFIKQRLNRTSVNPGSGGAVYSVFGDITADGRINALDLSGAKQRLNRRLPTGDPAATSLLFGSNPIPA